MPVALFAGPGGAQALSKLVEALHRHPSLAQASLHKIVRPSPAAFLSADLIRLASSEPIALLPYAIRSASPDLFAQLLKDGEGLASTTELLGIRGVQPSIADLKAVTGSSVMNTFAHAADARDKICLVFLWVHFLRTTIASLGHYDASGLFVANSKSMTPKDRAQVASLVEAIEVLGNEFDSLEWNDNPLYPVNGHRGSVKRELREVRTFSVSLRQTAPMADAEEPVKREESRIQVIARLVSDLVERATRNEIGGRGGFVTRFMAVSSLSRPSGHEEEVGLFFRALVQQARATVWKDFDLEPNDVVVQQDGVKNIMVNVPATGRFARRDLPAIAIQGHQDMVPEVVGLKAGQDPKPYFAKGVKVVETNGWLHSEGYRTTLGADNGTAIASTLRYVLDPTLEHPRLRLVLTVQEETTLGGAKHFSLSLEDTPVLVNVDAEKKNTLVNGYIGAQEGHVNGELPREEIPSSHQIIELSFGGLEGGHTGVAIHERRANAIRLFSELFLELQKSYPELRLISLLAGNSGAANVIPKTFTSAFALPNTISAREFYLHAQQTVEAMVRRDEPDKVGKTSLDYRRIHSQEGLVGLPSASAQKLFSKILDTPNGPPAPGLEAVHGPSSSLGYISVASNHSSAMDVAFVFLARGRTITEIGARARLVRDSLASIWVGERSSPHSRFPELFEPYVADANGWLFRLGLSPKVGFAMTRLEDGFMEAGEFVRRDPNLTIVCFGPYIKGPHSVSEAVEVEDAVETETRLQRYLEAIGDSPDFAALASRKDAGR